MLLFYLEVLEPKSMSNYVYRKDGEGAQSEVLELKQNCEILSMRYEKSEVRHAFWHEQSENVMQHGRQQQWQWKTATHRGLII